MENDYANKYNAFKTKNGNTVWAGALGLAWNDYCQTNKV